MSAAADSDSSAGSTPATGDAGQNGTARSVAAGSGQSGGQPVQVTVSVSGDHLIHGPVYRRAAQNAGGNGYNFKPMFKQIKPFIQQADLAICHIETPLTPQPPAGYPMFNTPPQLAKDIKATGWDACDTTSNHSLDKGQYGITETIKSLDAAGLAHTGTYTSKAASEKILIMPVKGTKIAFLSYTGVSNGLPQPKAWWLNNLNTDKILADAAKAKAQGADAVIVNLHWGNEYQHAPSAQQVQVAKKLTASPNITSVIGQHVHVVQPIARYHHKLVLFGEGNLISNQTPSCCAPGAQDGMIGLLRFEIVPGQTAKLKRIDYVPVWVHQPDYVVVPVKQSRSKYPNETAALDASWKRTTQVVGQGATWGPWTKPTP